MVNKFDQCGALGEINGSCVNLNVSKTSAMKISHGKGIGTRERGF